MSDSSSMNTKKPYWTDESSEDASQRLVPLKQCGKTIMERSYRVDYNLHIHNIDKFLRKHPNLPLSSVAKLKSRKNTTLYRLRIQQRGQQRDLFELVERVASEMKLSKICLQPNAATEAKGKLSRQLILPYENYVADKSDTPGGPKP